MDTFVTLYNRLLNRAPVVGQELSKQLINDAWHQLQARREWSFRRRSGIFAPPNIYTTGTASSNVGSGNPTLITGIGTTWTPQMVGSQIRLGGLLYPYYTIVAWLSATEILVDQPWAGADVTSVPYQIIKIYYPVPSDFGWFYAVVSIKDSYRLWTNVTESDLALLDPQRTNQGQTYAASFRGYTPYFAGTIGPVIPVTDPASPSPISTTTTGYSYVTNATYIIQVVVGGVSGVATFQWLRAGQTSFQPAQATSTSPQDLSDGVQIYWPNTLVYVANDIFIINAQSMVTQGSPFYELWPGPTYQGYLYPYIYIAKESDLSFEQPQLPPLMANRGDVILEMALASAARSPGTVDQPNPYFNLALAGQHEARVANMFVDLERNDEEVGVTNIDYQSYPFYPAPWMDGAWQQSHAPFLNASGGF